MEERITVKFRRDQLLDLTDALTMAESAVAEDMETLNNMDRTDRKIIEELAAAQTRYHKMALWLMHTMEEAGWF